MGLLAFSSTPAKFSARAAARQTMLRCLSEFDPDDDWLAEEIERQGQDATPDRLGRVREMVEDERKKLLEKLSERWA